MFKWSNLFKGCSQNQNDTVYTVFIRFKRHLTLQMTYTRHRKRYKHRNVFSDHGGNYRDECYWQFQKSCTDHDSELYTRFSRNWYLLHLTRLLQKQTPSCTCTGPSSEKGQTFEYNRNKSQPNPTNYRVEIKNDNTWHIKHKVTFIVLWDNRFYCSQFGLLKTLYMSQIK